MNRIIFALIFVFWHQTRPRRKKLCEKMLIGSKIILIIFFCVFPYFLVRKKCHSLKLTSLWHVICRLTYNCIPIEMSLRLFLEITNGIETFESKFCVFVICNKTMKIIYKLYKQKHSFFCNKIHFFKEKK